VNVVFRLRYESRRRMGGLVACCLILGLLITALNIWQLSTLQNQVHLSVKAVIRVEVLNGILRLFPPYKNLFCHLIFLVVLLAVSSSLCPPRNVLLAVSLFYLAYGP